MNKYSIFAKQIIEKYYDAFSPSFLFLHGDNKQEFSLRGHGVLYYTDALFLIIGLLALFRRKKAISLMLSALVLIAPLPSVASTVGVSYAVRSMLLGKLLILIIGLGIWTFIHEGKKYVPAKLLIALLSLAYVLQLVNFLDIYLLRNPIYNAEAANFSTRILANYLHRASWRKTDIALLSNEPRTPLKHYLFYTNSYTKNAVSRIAEMYKSGSLTAGTVPLLSCSDAALLSKESTVILDAGFRCARFSDASDRVHIAQLKDGGSVFTIVNDRLCSRYSLKRYPSHISLSDLAVEDLSNENFCKTFITRY